MVSPEGLRELVTEASQVPSRSLLRPAGVACSVAICGGGRSSRPTSWNGNVLRGMPMWREGEREAHFTHSETETGREGGRGPQHNEDGSPKRQREIFRRPRREPGTGRDICPRGGEGEVGKQGITQGANVIKTLAPQSSPTASSSSAPRRSFLPHTSPGLESPFPTSNFVKSKKSEYWYWIGIHDGVLEQMLETFSVAKKSRNFSSLDDCD